MGDTDGDGRPDLIVSDPNASDFAGEVRLYRGGRTGEVETPDGTVVGGPGEDGGIGWWSAGPGDLDGDGLADLAFTGGATVNEPEEDFCVLHIARGPVDGTLSVLDADSRLTVFRGGPGGAP